METDDRYWDKVLNIRTTGRDDSRSTPQCFPYEATEYVVLTRLANSGYIGKRDLLLDYGCGKGRVSFFLAYQTGCRALGIDYDERLIYRAELNQKRALSGNKVQLIHKNALEFDIPIDVNRVFFFNPFSVHILAKVIAKLLASYDESPRDLKLFFYYPSTEYDDFLENYPRLEGLEDILCYDLFEELNVRERIAVFRITDIN